MPYSIIAGITIAENQAIPVWQTLKDTKVAQIIGYEIPDSILQIADIVYDNIEQ